MKVAIIHNKDLSGVINNLGIQNKEFYNEKTVSMVAASLERAGHNVSILDGNMFIIERLQNFMPKVVEGEQMGMVFNMAYGIQGESRYTHLPSMLEMLGVPYVGSGPAGHALALDKVMTKMVWQNNGLATPDFWVFNSPEGDLSDVKYPVIVKPKMESVSFGLRVVNSDKDLRDAIGFILEEFNQQALVESFIRGREFCVGLLGNNPIENFPVLEIDLEGDPDAIQSVEDKQKKPRGKVCPAQISQELAARMIDLSKKAFTALNLKDFARVDIRMDEDENIYLLEINSMASLGMTGSYTYAAQVAGYDYQALVNRILDVAILRYFAVGPVQAVEAGQDHSKQNIFRSRLKTYLRGRQPLLEDFLKKLVNTGTNTRDAASVNTAAGYIAAELAGLGFISEVQPQLECGNQYYFSNSPDRKVDLTFLVSLDNKTRINEQQNYRETEHRLYGTGIWENKGGIVSMLGALQVLKFARLIKKVRIGIIMVTDNSIHGRYSRTLVEQKTRLGGPVLSFHGAGPEGSLVLSRSGAASYNFRLAMLEAASSEDITKVSRYFVKTISSILEISRSDPQELVAPYDMNFESNLFKGQAFGQAKFSARFNTMAKFEEMDSRIRSSSRIPGSLKKKVEISLHGGLNRPALIETPVSRRLFDDLKDISRDLYIRCSEEHRWSSSDICAVDDPIARLDGLGPAGGYDDNREYIIRNSLVDKALLVAAYITEKVIKA